MTRGQRPFKHGLIELLPVDEDMEESDKSTLDEERWTVYTTDLICLHCGRFIVKLQHREPIPPLLPVEFMRRARCGACGGPPIGDETLAWMALGRPPWQDPDKPRRGRPPNPLSIRNLREAARHVQSA